MRERETNRQTETGTDRLTERQTDRDRERQRQRERENCVSILSEFHLSNDTAMCLFIQDVAKETKLRIFAGVRRTQK